MPKILDSDPEQFLEQQKDLLFVQSGQDVEDLFYAFNYYKLTDWSISISVQENTLKCYFDRVNHFG